MQVEILGSGGATTTPRPGCDCRLCRLAREKGLPYSRTGPSIFVHGPDVLFDTPEEIGLQLNRSQITQIQAGFYSHWHPDHTMGRRVWEMNFDWRCYPPHNRSTDIYLPQQVALDMRHRLGSYEHLKYLSSRGVIRLIEMYDGQGVTINGYQIKPFRLAEDYVYAFVITRNGYRVLIVLDEMYGWRPPSNLRGMDLVILPMGLPEFHPLSGERLLAADHPVLSHEGTFAQTLEVVRALEPKRAILSHIEEVFTIDHDELAQVAAGLRKTGLPIEFAYDTMLIDV